MNICVSANSKYSRYLYVMLLSLFETNRNEMFRIYVFQRDFTTYDKDLISTFCESYKSKCEYIEIDEKDFACLPTTHRYSLETYFRFKIIEKVPLTIDKILYLDVDLIIRGNIRELYDTNIEGYYFAACNCMMQPKLVKEKQVNFGRYDDLRYFNAGVMLWNLQELRGNVEFEDFIQGGYDLHFDMPSVDQEILNYLFYDKTLYLNPYKYNYLVYKELNLQYEELELLRQENPIIYHYCWYNPWQKGPKSEKYLEWWSWAKKTPFYYDFLEEHLYRTEQYVIEVHKKLAGEQRVIGIEQALYFLKGSDVVYRYFEKLNCNIYLYGAGMLAKSFCTLLYDCGVTGVIQGVVDRKQRGEFRGIPMANDLSDFKSTNLQDDLLVITPSYESKELKRTLSEKYRDRDNLRIVLLEELLKDIVN